MPLPSWVTIPDSAVEPNAPITSGLMTALRDNIEAFAEGATGAPHMQTSLLAPGGSMIDGPIGNSSTVTNPGIYDFSAGSVTTTKSLPYLSWIRIVGDLTLSGTLNVGLMSAFINRATAAALGANVGNSGAVDSVHDCAGGGSVGAGGDGAGGFNVGGLGLDIANTNRFWVSKRTIVGGNAGSNLNGGGAVVLIVDGNLIATGGTINANGGVGATGSGVNQAGGGGGGTVIVICTGTITDGTFTANGGTGATVGSGGGGGGGGYVALIASAYAGTQVHTASAGAGGGSGSAGGAGVVTAITVAPGYINGLMVR